ncbi:MAG: hypothetical protein ACXWCZ_07455 [Flavisolibacter sp.]
MKKIIILLGSIVLINPLFANESRDTIPEPEFINFIYQFDKTNNKLVDLEKANIEMKMKTKVMGGGSPSYSIDGSKSTVRLNESAKSFMITISGGPMTTDPSNSMTLYKLESKKSSREAPMTSYGGMTSGKKSNNALELRFKKVREGTYEIVVAGNLEKGEYGFVNMNGMNSSGKMSVFAFGID